MLLSDTYCNSERSEESQWWGDRFFETLRFTQGHQNDIIEIPKPQPILIVILTLNPSINSGQAP